MSVTAHTQNVTRQGEDRHRPKGEVTVKQDTDLTATNPRGGSPEPKPGKIPQLYRVHTGSGHKGSGGFFPDKGRFENFFCTLNLL